MRFIIPLLVVFCAAQMTAQDPVFSQFYANRNYLSPAFTGIQKGINASTSHRSQWGKLQQHFTTTTASIDYRPTCHPHTGFGGSLFVNKEGDAALKTTGINVSYAQIIPFGGWNGRNDFFGLSNIHIGLKVGFYEYGIDWDKLVFTDQLDAIRGNIRPSVANQGLETRDFWDISSGMFWRQQWRRGKSGTRRTPWQTIVGASVHHILMPDNSLSQTDSLSRLPVRVTIHAGAKIPFTPDISSTTSALKKWYFVPNFKYDHQGNSSLNLGTTETWVMGAYIQPPWPFYAGLLWQHQKLETLPEDTKALVVIIGYDKKEILQGISMVVGLSYDMNLGALANEYSGGVVELTLRFNIKNDNVNCKRRKGEGREILGCEKFF